jgi:hypothetical protein
MARPIKHNLDYFPLDVGFFENHKLILIEEDSGVKGGYLALRLMAMVYEKGGYFLEWKDKSEFSCAKRVGNGYTGASVNEILKSCLRHGLFDKQMFEQHRILTSAGIQEQWLKVMRDLRRKVEINPKFSLVNAEETGVNAEETREHPEETTAPATESTLKEKKGNEIKEEHVAPLTPAPPEKLSSKKTEKVKEAEPYWDQLVKTWFDFNLEKFSDKPSFSDADPKHFKKIIEKLKKRAAAKKVEWTEVTGPKRLKDFLDSAFADSWLCKHFLLKNLNEQFDAIILKQQEKAKAAVSEKTVPKSAAEKTQLEISYLFDRYREGQLQQQLIKPDYYDWLVLQNKIQSKQLHLCPGNTIEEQKRNGVIRYFETIKSQVSHAS